MRIPPATLALAVLLAATPAIAAAASATTPPASAAAPLPDLLADLAPGLSARVLLRAGTPMTDGVPFPPKNDLTAYVPLNAREGYLMVGHELRWGKDPYGGRFSRLLLRDGEVTQSQVWSSGMHNNCAGALTPWHTVLTGEEYPHDTYPGKSNEERRAAYLGKRLAAGDPLASWGWLYEITPHGGTPAGAARRLTALGRFSHESAEVVGDREVYLTEDYDPGFLYKFVADRPRDLASGKLYAYVRDQARWVPLGDTLNAHHAAEAAGATKFIRLEDIKRGPDGALYFAETGHFKWNDPYGRVWRLDPRTSKAKVIIQGDGKQMAQPDNLLFDRQGRLLVCEDQYDENVAAFGPNEVLRYDGRGGATRLAATPVGSEPTGPSLAPGGRTMFLSVMWGDRSGVVAIDGM